MADAPPVPRPDHVVIVVEENRSFDAVMRSADAPYIRSLARRGALLTNSFGVAHPSQPNYLALFSGSTQGVVSDVCPLQFSTPNLSTLLAGAGLSFVSFADSMPSAGFTGCDTGVYHRKHDPWADFTNVPASTQLRFTDLPDDLTLLPTVAFVIPDDVHNMHDGSIAQADAWLRDNVDRYVRFAATHNSLLIVTWDEDDTRSGNHIPTLLVGPMVRQAPSRRLVSHFDVLRTVEAMYRLAPIGDTKTAHAITDVWQKPVFGSPASVVAPADVPFTFELAVAGDPSATFAVTPAPPPGLRLTGSRTLEGTPTTPGTFVLDVRAGSALGPRAQSLVVVVTKDADGDGFSDDVESALATDAGNAASTPTGATAALPVACSVDRFSAALRFDRSGRDALSVRGSVSLGAGFSPSGVKVVVAVGGVARTFVLDASGRAASGPDASFALGTDGKFALQMKKASIASALAAQGLANATARRAPAGALVTVVVGSLAFETVERLVWTARAGVSGKAVPAR